MDSNATKPVWSRKKTPVDPDGYTQRERDILVYLSKGFNLVEAGKLMGLSPFTLRDNMKAVLAKMDASTQAEAVYRAVKEGVIE